MVEIVDIANFFEDQVGLRRFGKIQWLFKKSTSPGQKSIVEKLDHKLVRGQRSHNVCKCWCSTLLPFPPPLFQFWLGPVNVLLLKGSTYFCFKVWLAHKQTSMCRGYDTIRFVILTISGIDWAPMGGLKPLCWISLAFSIDGRVVFLVLYITPLLLL